MKELNKERFANKIKKELKNGMKNLSYDEIKALLKKYNIEPDSSLKLSNIYQLIEEVNWDYLYKEVNPMKDPIIEFDGKTFHYSVFQDRKPKANSNKNKRHSTRKVLKTRKVTSKKTTQSTKNEIKEKTIAIEKQENEIILKQKSEEKPIVNTTKQTGKTKEKTVEEEPKVVKEEKPIVNTTKQTGKTKEKTFKEEKPIVNITKQTERTFEESDKKNEKQKVSYLNQRFITLKNMKYILDFMDKTSGQFNTKMAENLNRTPKEDQEKAMERRFNYPRIKELNIFHSIFSDIYFIYNYIPNGRRNDYKKQNIKLSKGVEELVKTNEKIIDYKYHNKFVNYFTKDFFKAIKNIYINYFNDKEGIALIAIPPSKKGVSPQTKKSIDLIEEWCEEGKNDLDFKIYNFSDFLIRTKNVASSKTGNRTLKKHQESIICQKDYDVPSNTGFIILDDITTTGNTMYSCRDILINNGFENKDIISLALGRDVDANNELVQSKDGVILIETPNVEKFD